MSVRRRMLLPALLAALLPSGCGSGDRPAARIRGTTLTVYFSGPFARHASAKSCAGESARGFRLDHIERNASEPISSAAD